MNKLEAQKIAAKTFRINLVGNKFHHFKGHNYIVDNVVLDANTLIIKVIYHNIEDPDLIWDRSLDDFLSPVDKEKYPDVDQLYKFESIED